MPCAPWRKHFVPNLFRKRTVGAAVPTVRLMNEYGVRWPLWGDMDNYPYELGVLPLSDRLTADLLSWAESFQEQYDHEHGWPSGVIAEAHFDEGHRLAAALQGELGAAFVVEIGLWETNRRR